jgi:hypothetical protein
MADVDDRWIVIRRRVARRERRKYDARLVARGTRRSLSLSICRSSCLDATAARAASLRATSSSFRARAISSFARARASATASRTATCFAVSAAAAASAAAACVGEAIGQLNVLPVKR